MCELAATGLTNRQIADERCVGVKAVEFHLHNAFVKLDVANRTQLALLWLAQPDTGPGREPGDAPHDHAAEAAADPPRCRASRTDPATASRDDIAHATEAILREVLTALRDELGERELSPLEVDSLNDQVAACVAHEVEARLGLRDTETQALEHALRQHLELTEATAPARP